jgi:phosphosulfolactate synthase
LKEVFKMQRFADFLEIDYPRRSSKPRKEGITMVMDQGWPWQFVEGMLQEWGEYLDVAKLWDVDLKAPLKTIQSKIRCYKEYGVKMQPGGIYLEISRGQGREDEALSKLKELGFDIIEVSSTTSSRENLERDSAFVKKAKSFGFTIFGEVGRKFADGDKTRLTEDTIDIETTIAEFEALLKAGAEKVYWEGHLLRRVIGETPEEIKAKANTGTRQVQEVAKRIGQDKIIFEASGLVPITSRRLLQFWLIRLFGPEVNIGNARIEEMANLEALRAGSHPIFGFGNLGNYAWLRSMENTEAEWWKGV